MRHRALLLSTRPSPMCISTARARSAGALRRIGIMGCAAGSLAWCSIRVTTICEDPWRRWSTGHSDRLTRMANSERRAARHSYCVFPDRIRSPSCQCCGAKSRAPGRGFWSAESCPRQNWSNNRRSGNASSPCWLRSSPSWRCCWRELGCMACSIIRSYSDGGSSGFASRSALQPATLYGAPLWMDLQWCLRVP